MQLIKNILCMLLISTQVTQAISFSGYFADFYNRYRSQSAIVQLIIPAALFSTLGATLYYKYVYTPQMAKEKEEERKKAEERARLVKENAELQARLSAEKEKGRLKQLEAEQKKLQEKEQLAKLKKEADDKREERYIRAQKEFEAEKLRIKEQKEREKIADQQRHLMFFTPLKKYQSKQLENVLSTVSNESITTLYHNAGSPAALIIPPEIVNEHQNDLPEVLSRYNLTLSGWTKSNWNIALKELNNQHSFSVNLLRPIQLQQVPQLINDAKAISKAFLPPHAISSADQEQHFFTKKHSSARRIFTYIKLKQIIEKKKLSHIRLPLKFLVIQNEQTKEYITDKQIIEPLIDKHMTIELDYIMPKWGTLKCTGPLFLDPEDTYNTALLAEKITDSGKTLNDDAFDELKQLVQEAPFDIGYGNIFIDTKGDAIIIDTEFKGEPTESCIAKLNRY